MSDAERETPKTSGTPLAFIEQSASFAEGGLPVTPRFIDRLEWVLTEEGLTVTAMGGALPEAEFTIPADHLGEYVDWLRKPLEDFFSEPDAFPTRPADGELR